MNGTVVEARRVSNTKAVSGHGHRAHWFIILVLPVFSLISAIKNFSKKEYRIFIVLFGVMYGYTFIPIKGSDGESYANSFKAIKSYTYSKYISDITSIGDEESDFPDVYAFTLFFLVSKLSDDPQVFHMVSGFFYFWVYIALMGTIRDLVPGRIGNKYYLWFFLGCVFIMNFSSGINGVRFGTAFMVFAYGTVNLFLKNKVKFLLMAATSILIHFSLLYPVILLLLFYLARYPTRTVYLYVFLLLAIVSTVFSTFITSNIDVFGTTVEHKFNEYTDASFMERREEHTDAWRWYIRFDGYSTFYVVNIGVLLVRFFAKNIRYDKFSQRLFSFSLLMFGASLISGALVDSISNRYILLANLMSLVYLLYISYLNQSNNFMRNLRKIYLPVFIIHALVVFRADFYTISPWLIFGNPVLMMVFKSEKSIQDLIIDLM